MPEAVKEVVTEVPKAALKKENTPETLPCKEVKPAEASSGTLPAVDEPPKDDSEEVAIAPDLGQGEAPEQGKSETNKKLNDVPMDKEKDIPENEGKGCSTEAKEDSISNELKPENSNVNTDNVSDNCNKDNDLVEKSKGPISESMEPKAEESMETDSSNSLDSKPVENNKTEKDVEEAEVAKNDESGEKENCNAESLKEKEVDKKDDYEEEKQNKETNELESATEEENSIVEAKENKNQGEPMEESNSSHLQETMDCHNEEKKTIKQESENSIIENEDAMETTVEGSEDHNQAKNDNTDNEDCKMPQKKESIELNNQNEMPVSETKTNELKEIAKTKDSENNIGNLNDEESSKNGQEPSEEKASKELPVEHKTEKSDSDQVVSENSDVKIENCSDPKEKTNSENDIKSVGSTDGSGGSKSVDIEAAEEVKRQMREGKGLLAVGNHFSAADVLGKACEAAGKLYGDLANENAELYYLYGCAMLECAKNENNVLGEGVKDKEAEEDADDVDVEVNGDEEMETDENGANDEEKMTVDDNEAINEEEAKEDADSEKNDAGEQSADNGIDDETKKENPEEEEEDSSLKVAWEMFELAKIAFTRMGNESRLADTYIKLGEVGIESGHQAALDDMKAALELRKKCCTENPRIISETHFNLGLGYATFEMFDEAIEQFKASKSLLEAKIDSLLKTEEQKAQEEIKDIKELLPDLEEKIQDMRDSKVTKLQQPQNGEQSSLDKTENSKPVSNITHLVKRKRKLEDVAHDLLPTTKQQCTEKSPETEQSAE